MNFDVNAVKSSNAIYKTIFDQNHEIKSQKTLCYHEMSIYRTFKKLFIATKDLIDFHFVIRR